VGTLAFANQAGAITPTITEYSSGLPAGANLEEIAAGPDGNLWFTEQANPGHVDLITTVGTITEFGTANGLTVNSNPFGIAAGPDGNVWFTEVTGNRVGEITPSGSITEFGTANGLSPSADLQDIAPGPNGALWFSEDGNMGKIGRIDPTTHAITEFGTANGLTANSTPYGITPGPDGNVWFTEAASPGRIGRINPTTHAISEFGTANGLTVNSQPLGITAGPDGNLWFTEYNDPGRIGRINPNTGAIVEFGTASGLTANRSPSYIITGPDGALWFTEYGNTGTGAASAIGRIDPGTGAITEFGAANGLTANSGPYGITVGPDGNLWFVEFNSPARVGRITTPPIAKTVSASATGPTAASVTGTANGHAQATSFHIEYRPIGGATTATPEQSLGTTRGDTPASAALTGLAPNTAYQARFVVTNPTDTRSGAFLTFTTAALPQGTPRAPAPTLIGASQTHKSWREGNALAQTSRKRKPPVGTTFSFTLNEVAAVRMDFTQSTSGRRQGSKCVHLTRRNGGARKCTLTTIPGTLSFTGHTGLNKVGFQGRISRSRKLKPGRYTLVITAIGSTGARSAQVKLSFTIVKG
jgi:streptogramin lyase